MSAIPFDMFDLDRSADQARRYDRLKNIYGRGQALAWNGGETLDRLVEKHGGLHIPADKHAAVGAVFGTLMWGELAAWRISAQLADRLEPLEAKMAATSQAHDEARHFYVLHDYLRRVLGGLPARPSRASGRLLDLVLGTDDLACKLLGMQLQVETSALTMFQQLRECGLCPVLTELLLLFEKDEARHVGLGVQFLPMLMARMNGLERARLTAFTVRVSLQLVLSHRTLDPHLRRLGIDPRQVLRLAKSKQELVFDELWGDDEPGDGSKLGEHVSLLIEAVADAMWPADPGAGVVHRMRTFFRALKNRGVEGVSTSIVPGAPEGTGANHEADGPGKKPPD